MCWHVYLGQSEANAQIGFEAKRFELWLMMQLQNWAPDWSCPCTLKDPLIPLLQRCAQALFEPNLDRQLAPRIAATHRLIAAFQRHRCDYPIVREPIYGPAIGLRLQLGLELRLRAVGLRLALALALGLELVLGLELGLALGPGLGLDQGWNQG